MIGRISYSLNPTIDTFSRDARFNDTGVEKTRHPTDNAQYRENSRLLTPQQSVQLQHLLPPCQQQGYQRANLHSLSVPDP